MDESKLPEILSRAGTAGKTVMAPPEAVQDQYSAKSGWWQFRELLDMVKGDEIGSKYNVRQSMVKRRPSAVLDDFMAKCVEESRATVKTLKMRMSD